MSDSGRRRKEPEPVPTIRDVHGWRQCLLDNPSLIDYLEQERGLTPKVIGRYRIGFARAGRFSTRSFEKFGAFTLPVFTWEGEVVTVRRRFYREIPKDENCRPTKYAGLAGHPATLFPSEPDIGPVMLVAGEFDALCGRSNGLPTTSTTCGASLPAELASRFRGRSVAVVFDASEDEQRSADRVVERLLIGGADAWRVDLRDRGLRDGEDVTDWFVKYGRSARELRRLANVSRASRRAT
ncbi:MAG: hypothetical protein WAO61_09420 [Solirubrobacterales bacterium]